ncbi:ABC transporter permease [Pseudogemmobacter sonorensis]|uniref:ABC transporter permease n=1 Tax=Pseudogemmobacter sonorensis TaxID=2989681 RepID=UPI0036BC123D
MKRRILHSPAILAGPNLVWLALFLLGALLVLVDVSFRVYSAGGVGVTDELTVANYTNFLTDPFLRGILMRSLEMAGVVVLGTVILGLPLATTLSRTTGRARTILYFLILIPLMTSVVVRTFGWMMLLSNNGLFNGILRDLGLITRPFRMMYNMIGVDLVMIQVHLPFMVLALDAALLNINPQIYEAARNLGASRLRTFVRITLPLCIPGLVSGTILVFALAISSYVTPALIGGPRNPVMAMLIYQQGVALLNWPFGAAISICLLLLLLALLAGFLALTARFSRRIA